MAEPPEINGSEAESATIVMSRSVAYPSMRTGATHVVVAVGISRVAGLIRERVFAHYLGTSAAADAFGAAFRIPMLLESLLGERVLASAFIPRYSRLLAQDAAADASRLARAVAAFHVLMVTAIVLAGVLLAPLLVSLVARGFDAEKSALTVKLVRILFPTVGLLVLGTWCLSVLSSHRRFFLSYIVPVLSAASISIALIWSGRAGNAADIAGAAAWGALIGALLQLIVQLPFALRVLGEPAAGSPGARDHLREVGRNVVPGAWRGVIGRAGTLVEVAIAGFVSTGAVAALNYAQLVYTLPMGLFTVAVSAALLPELSAAGADHAAIARRIHTALHTAMRHTAYLLVASAAAFIALGDVIVAAVYYSGEFDASDVTYVWSILAAMSIGLVGTSMSGLQATAFYALGDTRSPLRATVFRLAVRAALGVLLAIPVVRVLGLEPRWGAAGLAAAIGISGWIEFVLLRRWLNQRLRLPPQNIARFIVALWSAALVAVGIAWIVKLILPLTNPILRAIIILGAFGAAYVGITLGAGVREPLSFLDQLRSRSASRQRDARER